MRIEHRARQPDIHGTAYVAPTAVISGAVRIGAECRILHGAVITAEGGPVTLGDRCVVMETAVIRGTKRHPARIGNDVLIGPRAYLSGCSVADSVFLATGATVFNGAHVGKGAQVRINGVVHLKTRIAPGAVVPIGWVAVGDPAAILPAGEHDAIWAIQKDLNFPREVFGLERPAGAESLGDIMPALAERYTRALAAHWSDRVLVERGRDEGHGRPVT